LGSVRKVFRTMPEGFGSRVICGGREKARDFGGKE